MKSSLGKQVATIGRFVCGVMRTVIPSPSDLIWDGSATFLSNGGWIEVGDGNLSKSCHLSKDMALSPKLDFFRLGIY